MTKTNYIIEKIEEKKYYQYAISGFNYIRIHQNLFYQN